MPKRNRGKRHQRERRQKFRRQQQLLAKNEQSVAPNANYEKLVSGIIRVGESVMPNDVLIGRITSVQETKVNAQTTQVVETKAVMAVQKVHKKIDGTKWVAKFKTLSSALAKHLCSFLCWIDNFALSRTCKALNNSCRPFSQDLFRLLAETDLERKNVENMLDAGMCITGSTILQAAFGVRYYDMTDCARCDRTSDMEGKYCTTCRHDMDMCMVPSCYDIAEDLSYCPTHRAATTVYERKRRSDIDVLYLAFNNDVLRGSLKKASTLLADTHPTSQLVAEQTKNEANLDTKMPRYENPQTYENILPLFCTKYKIFPAGEVPVITFEHDGKTFRADQWWNLPAGDREGVPYNVMRPALDKQEGLAKQADSNTIVELVGIKNHKSAEGFIDHLVDVSIGMVYFGYRTECHPYEYDYRYEVMTSGGPKLHWRNMHDLWERKFSVRWNLDRYVRDKKYIDKSHYTRAMWRTESAMLHDLAYRLAERRKKYEDRGFACRNPLVDEKGCAIHASEHADKAVEELLPPCPQSKMGRFPVKTSQDLEDEYGDTDADYMRGSVFDEQDPEYGTNYDAFDDEFDEYGDGYD